MRNVILIGLLGLCAAASAETPHFTLPTSWYVLPEDRSDGIEFTDARPTVDLTTLFRTHVRALESLPEESLVPSPGSTWGLRGMTAEFGISSSGIFGALSDSGSLTVSASWKNQKAPSSLNESGQRSIEVNTSTDEEALDVQFETVIRAAVASGAVQNEAMLRAHLRQQGRDFLTLAQAMASVSSNQEWDASGLKLELSFHASGDVTPVVGVGGTVDLSLTWSKPAAPLEVPPSPLRDSLKDFVEAVSEEIPIALSESSSAPGADFKLKMFTVGIVVTIDGDIGVVDAGGSISAELIFSHKALTSRAPNVRSISRFVNLIGSKEEKRSRFASAKGIAASDSRLANAEPAIIFKIPKEQFKKGLAKAIDMTAFVAKQGASQDSANWKLSTVSAVFGLSITGDLAFATVEAKGQIGLRFSRRKGD